MIMSYETNIQMKVKSGEQNIGEKHSFNHKWWFFLVLKQKWFFGILFFENYLMLNEEKRAYMLRNLIFQTKVNSYFLATAKVDKIKKHIECELHHGLS